MSNAFNHPPTVGFLSRLTKGDGLKNPRILQKAIRLWVMLRSIYGDEVNPVYCTLGESFTFVEWRDQFFEETKPFHNKDDKNSLGHNHPDCPCQKTIMDWLFRDDLGCDKKQWIEEFSQLYTDSYTLEEIGKFLETGYWGAEGEKLLLSTRIFACVGRTFKNNLQELTKLGFLDYDAQTKKYYKQSFDHIEQLVYPPKAKERTPDHIDYIPFIVQEDFNEIPALFYEKIAGTRRFFMHIDYAISSKDIHQDWPYYFKTLWEKDPTPVITLKYNSVSLHREVSRVVYPVCIYYYQRAVYLCAYGQTPKQKQDVNWYNYRLDRILDVTPMTWEDAAIPDALKALQTGQILFTPDYIDLQLREAMGFDFYQPKKTMILRFDKVYSEKYIDESFRHETFESLKTPKDLEQWQAQRQISPGAPRSGSLRDRQIIGRILSQWHQMDSNNPTHSYFRVDYRVNDNNVIMRLRAWGDKVEVLYPPALRQRMADDSRKMAALYQDS
jgi:CRISPR-associated protein (TIGR03985 family)